MRKRFEAVREKKEMHDDKWETNRKVNGRSPKSMVMIATDTRVKNRNLLSVNRPTAVIG